jgi:hypothetical protein
MKRLLLILAMVLLPMVALASPFLTCDPYPTTVTQPTEFGIIMDTASVDTYVPATTNTDGSKGLNYDLANLAIGAHNVKVRACVPDTSTTPAGRSCSDYTPFSFSITPKAPSAPRLFLKP